MSGYLFQLRRGTAAQWATKNPVLRDGEPGLERDTGRLKVGDGGTAWADLPYVDTTGLADKADAADTAAALATKANASTVGALTTRVDTTETRVGTVEDEVGGRLSQASLSSTFVAPSSRVALNPVTTAKRGAAPTIRTLISGTEDEVLTLPNGGGSIVADTVNYKVGKQGWKFAKVGGGTGTVRLTQAAPYTFGAVQAVGLWVWISDVTLISYITVDLYTDATFTTGNRWRWASTDANLDTRWTGGPLKTGWNFVRVAADHNAVGASATWPTVHRVDVLVNSTNTVDVTIGHLYVETPAKARMIFVADRGYKSFYDYAYPKLKAANIPVTFAVDTTLFGSQAGTEQEAMTEAQIHACAKENGNSISFHGYDGAATATMTAAQLRTDTAKAIKWLQQFGYTGRYWRAAFVQNNAPQWAAVEDLMLAARSPIDTTNRNGPWPSIHPMKMPFQQTDNSRYTTTAQIDATFDDLARTRALYIPFLHGVSTYTFNLTPALFDYWLGKVTDAINAGWLEAVTFEQLFLESGGSFSTAGGATVATWTDPSGNRVSKNVL